MVRLGQSFDTLCWTLPIPLLATVSCLGIRPKQVPEDARPDPRPPGTLALATLALTAIFAWAWHQGWVPWPVPWLALLVHMAWLWHRRGPATRSLHRGGSALHLAGLALASCGAALAALWINRPEGDDGYYLAQVAWTVFHSDLPLLSFDVLHGDVSLPIQQVAHRAQGFETFVSVVVAGTGLSAHDAYYVLLPPLFSALSVVICWVLARDLAGPLVATSAALAFTLILVWWGGHHYSYGNYGFVRMFQGKGFTVTLAIPLVLWSALRFSISPGPRHWLMLMGAQCVAAFGSSTGLIVGPLAAGLALLAQPPTRAGQVRAFLVGLAASIPVLGMLALVRLDITDPTQMEATGKLTDFYSTLGETGYAPLAVVLFAAAPMLLRALGVQGASWLAGYGLVTVALLLQGLLAPLVAEHGGALYSWRLYWALPMASLAAIGVGALTALAVRRRGVWVLCWAASVGALWGLADLSWKRTNGATLDFAGWKIPALEARLTRYLLEHSDSSDVALAPWTIAARLTPYRERPTLVAVRRGYLQHLERGLGTPEVDARIALYGWVNEGLKTERTPWVVDELDRRCVTVLVTRTHLHDALPGLRGTLESRGWSLQYDPDAREPRPLGGRYRLYLRDSCPDPDAL